MTAEEEEFLDSLLEVVQKPESNEGGTSGKLAGNKVVVHNDDDDDVTRSGLVGSSSRSEPNSCAAYNEQMMILCMNIPTLELRRRLRPRDLLLGPSPPRDQWSWPGPTRDPTYSICSGI